ncbi:hypothetical protein Q8F55_008186 [Vanrija albida]|uniref:Uncharacterized protein n=1 Tax=Vanrija albida TaxID=181172 RepID=A0ABR3PVJ1_9TREE
MKLSLLALILAPLAVLAQDASSSAAPSADAGPTDAAGAGSDPADASQAPATEGANVTTSAVASAPAASGTGGALNSHLTIYSPSATNYWVGNTNNTLAWSGTGPTAFSVWLLNANASLLQDTEYGQVQNGALKLKTWIKTSVSSLQIWSTRTNSGGDGYTVQLRGVNDSSVIFATSEPFTIRPWNSTTAVSVSLAPVATGTGVTISDPETASHTSTAHASASSSKGSSAGKAASIGAGAVAFAGAVALLI